MTSSLADATFWVAVVACAVAQIGILRATIAARHPNVPAKAGDAPSHRSATRVEEIVWALLPVVALGATLWFTWRALHPAGVV